jgi:hypothetical protein
MKTRWAIALQALLVGSVAALAASATGLVGGRGGGRAGPAGDFLAALPEIPLGRPRVIPSYVNSPGYVRPADPESLSEWTGRREVGPISEQLLFAAPSAESLAAAIVEAVEERSAETLKRLLILPEEFEAILWPEFPASRPYSNVTAADAWGNHMGHVIGGVGKGLGAWEGGALRFRRLSARGVMRYANFNLVDGVLIHAVDARGRDVVFDFATTFVERNGRWKVYIYME